MAPRVAYTQPQAGPQGFARTKKVFGGTVNILTTDLALNAVTAIARVPAGFVLQGIYTAPSDMDTNGTPTVVFTIGDSGSANRLVVAANGTGAQTGAINTTLASTGSYYQFTVDTDILMTITTGAATAAAGTMTCYLEGFMANP